MALARSSAMENAITAIDIALDPDAAMIQHAQTANVRLLKAYPNGFALYGTHHPHLTLLHRYVRTADLDNFYDAVGDVFANKKGSSLEMRGVKYVFHALG